MFSVDSLLEKLIMVSLVCLFHLIRVELLLSFWQRGVIFSDENSPTFFAFFFVLSFKPVI
jgi:hypothetical protein